VLDQTSQSEAASYWFDEAAANAASSYFPRYLRFTKDKWAGRPFQLQPWQEQRIIRPLFGWKKQDGTRRYRRVIVFLPRKNGKTELASGVGLLALTGDATYGGEVYSIAKDEDQAKIVFEKAAQMVSMSPELSQGLTCFKTSIFWPEKQSRFMPLTGTAKGKHGLNASGLIGDELHEWLNGDLYDVIHKSEAARDQPIEFLISTAGIKGFGYGWEIWNEAQEILANPDQDPETLVVIFAADESDDWTSPDTWAKANPNLGVSVNVDFCDPNAKKHSEAPDSKTNSAVITSTSGSDKKPVGYPLMPGTPVQRQTGARQMISRDLRVTAGATFPRVKI